ncbi:hypothetical protein [Fischerella sp. JS2]|uniref:hypothetical protein n=1 Tax=Fischerella sp. JS2 TaxID=2597771 RepID=UPI0028E711F8|nr:hypothetical protein [Fischerella sp. JS2]
MENLLKARDGIIGQSQWKDWLRDQEYIWEHRANYKIFDAFDPSSWLPNAIAKTKAKIQQGEGLPGFRLSTN